MKKKNILLIALLAILSIIAYYLTQSPIESGKKDAEYLLNLDSSEIIKFDIKNRNDSFTAELLNGKWMISKPILYPADTFKLKAASSQSAKIEIIDIVSENPEKFKLYGLDTNAALVKIFTSTTNKLILVGNMSDNPGQSFVQIPDEKRVYLVKGALSLLFNAPLKDWRDRSVLLPDSSAINRIYFSGMENFELNLIDSLWFVNGKQADNRMVQRLVSQIRNLETDFFEDNPNQTLPALTQSISFNNKTISLYKIDNERHYLKSSDINQLYIVLNLKSNILLKKASDFLQTAN